MSDSEALHALQSGSTSDFEALNALQSEYTLSKMSEALHASRLPSTNAHTSSLKEKREATTRSAAQNNRLAMARGRSSTRKPRRGSIATRGARNTSEYKALACEDAV